MPLGDRPRARHVGEASVEVHGQDAGDRTGRAGDRGLDRARVEVQRRGIDVGEDRPRTEARDGAARREERERASSRPARPGPDAERVQREQAAHPCPTRRRSHGATPQYAAIAALEPLDVRAEDALLVGQHLLDGVLHRRAERARLRAQIDRGNFIAAGAHSYRVTGGKSIGRRSVWTVGRCSDAAESIPCSVHDGTQGPAGGVFGRILRWVAVAGLLAGVLAAAVVYRELTIDLPPVDQLLRYQPPTATRVFGDDGTLIGEFFVERRYLVPLERVPMHVRLAFLGAEDADFYRHRGVDPVSIARAFLHNMRSGATRQGGSTITQQVVKNLLLTNERSWQRKAREAILALKLETTLSKDDILYLYLNQIYFGGNAYGIAAAAKTYFDVEVEDLTVAQAALLAGLPQAPSRYDPGGIRSRRSHGNATSSSAC